jgi:small multidrug resistance family-3 protein
LLLLTRIEPLFAVRAFAVSGGVYISASLLWLWVIEGQRPDKWDILGAATCIVGTAIILLGSKNPKII